MGGVNAPWRRAVNAEHGRGMKRPMFVKRIAQATVVAQTLFVMGFLAVGAAEGHGYRWMRDDISDLGAQTAHHATVWRLLLLVTGAVTMAFGLLVVGPVFGSPLAGVLVALSLPAFDNLTDASSASTVVLPMPGAAPRRPSRRGTRRPTSCVSALRPWPLRPPPSSLPGR